MAFGVAAVVTDVGDSATIVGDTGKVVRAGDASALAEAIIDSLRSDSAPLRAGRRARIVENFELESMVSATLAVLLDVAGSSETRR